MDSKQQGEFIYSTHLWGGLFNLGRKQNGTSTPAPTAPKTTPAQQNPPKERKESGHEWDHEEINIHEFGLRKMSEDENIDAFGPFGALI